ncbi:amino acid ABC transporter permease [Tianweitania sediminis]|uniref:Amino acid ABC transporter permease n=1 Tax=Tianweitania sediminis TaxID=1502156 RepID=A0A8J7UJP9_9HYPH|nr:amino acid ABC transporter permease [Tianweitania sediminis]MBP0439050.1 amino acid ABC transporter permease [Tianweitania sediminis]
MATDSTHLPGPAATSRSSALNNPQVRSIIAQVVLVVLLALFIWWIVGNTTDNLRRQNIASGFGFLDARAGFDVAQSLIPYGSNSLYRQAFLVGLLNTLLVAVTGIITASIIGFLVGVGRLSRNWLIRQICMVYVEVFRNIPPLLVIFFIYLGVLSALPGARDSLEVGIPLGIQTPFGLIGWDDTIGFNAWLNNRGFFIPRPVFNEGSWLILAGLIAGLVMSVLVYRWARARQMATGEQFPVLRTSILLILGLPLLAYFLAGMPVDVDVPVKGNFNLTGGVQVKPEFLSLYLALSLYTASFIAEIVRAGILGVSRGQTEAAYALGVRAGPTLRLIIIPQAMRIIIPPLTSQYLNLTKNSSLAVAIGYPDLVQIGQTAMNQSGQAIEVVAIWMVVYLTISLTTSVFMNWFNNRMSLVER